MVQKYCYGTPFETESVIEDVPVSAGDPAYGSVTTKDGFTFYYEMDEEDIVYGLGEAVRGINKRGHKYVSFCMDDFMHTEDKHSLYAAHNFLVISGKTSFGLYVDYPTTLTFDIGYTDQNKLFISCENADLYLYVITGNNAYDIVKQFRKIIGRSYIPPKFAFGFGQSRWGYQTQDDFRNVVKKYRDLSLPIDMIYLDIDYMDHYKDFTVNPTEFPDFKGFVADMKGQNVHPIPIIDAGVKIEKGYKTYEEGVAGNYFCKREDGSDAELAVWPGFTHMPDFLNKEARDWFGNQYKYLTDQGIDGFWNDMNEPAIFYSNDGLDEFKQTMADYLSGKKDLGIFDIMDAAPKMKNSMKDYQSFYHNVDGKKYRHDKVHNLYGYNMTRSAGEAFERISPDKRILMFSRASYIGMHRYGGIWTGDNMSWWSHILLNLKMMPSLNMCGFLYSGADLGGFGANTTRDLLLRWLALGVFTPLMRDHSAMGTREQECYQFDKIEDFRHILQVRYRLIPYIYSEFMKAALSDDMYAKPLAFDFLDDPMAAQVEDQILIGNEIMIAPVYTQNAKGRYVYLPEEMMFVKFLPDGSLSEKVLPQGHHYVEIGLNEVPLFIRKDKCIPLVAPAQSVPEIDMSTLSYIGYKDASYELYDDDGVSRNYSL